MAQDTSAPLVASNRTHEDLGENGATMALPSERGQWKGKKRVCLPSLSPFSTSWKWHADLYELWLRLACTGWDSLFRPR